MSVQKKIKEFSQDMINEILRWYSEEDDSFSKNAKRLSISGDVIVEAKEEEDLGFELEKTVARLVGKSCMNYTENGYVSMA